MNIVQMTGFEHGSSLGLRLGPAGQTQFDFSNGVEGTNIIVQNDNVRTGVTGYACRFVVTTSQQSNVYWCATGGSPGNSLPIASVLVGRFWWCPESLTGASPGDVPAIAHVNSSAGGNSYFEYHESTGQLSLALGTGTIQYSPVGSIVVGKWYAIDFRLNMSGTAWTGDWQINGVQMPQATQTATADHITEIRLGCTSPFNITMSFDDVYLSQTAADYPLIDAHIVGLPINGSGTHVDTANFRQSANNGSTMVAISNPDTLVEDRPPTIGSSAGIVAQTATDANGYLEFTHAAPQNSTVYALKHIIAGWASGGGSANLAIVLQDGATSGHTLGTPAVPINPNWFFTSSSQYWCNQTYGTAPAGEAWSDAVVDRLTTRIGYSTSLGAQLGMNAAYLEVLIGPPPPPPPVVITTSVLATPTYTLGSWTANIIDQNGVTWGVEKPNQTGWHDGAPVRLNGVVGGVSTPLNIPRYDGSYRSRSYRDSKTIILTGWASAPNKYIAEQAWDEFLGLFEGGAQLQLVVTDDYTTRTAMVEISDIPKVSAWETGTGFDWQLSLLAVDPRKYALYPVTASTGRASATGGLTFPLDWTGGSTGGLVWGTVTSTGQLTLNNSGSAETWPTFTLIGPLTTPTITNKLTGQQLAYSQNIPAGASLIISTSPYSRTVQTGNGADQRANMSSAQWFSVPAKGSVSVQITTGSGADTGSISALCYPAYW